MKEGKLMLGGAVAAAVGASLCCVLPLVSVVIGVGVLGAASSFGAARPYLLVVAVLLLAYGFYNAYFRRDMACAPNEVCATKPIGSASRAGLWVASLAVLLFALSPYYAGALARRATMVEPDTSPVVGQPSAASGAATTTATAKFKVSGMTCAACEPTVRLALERVSGVRRAEVSYNRGAAIVEYDPQTVTIERLRAAIDATGYKVEGVEQEEAAR